MKLSRIDQIALNGATGEHYKYQSVAEDIIQLLFLGGYPDADSFENDIIKILVENFPNDAT